MRPDISEELIRRVIEKWRRENKLAVEIPKSKILEDILLRYLETPVERRRIRDRKRDRLMRKFLKMKYLIRPGYYRSPINVRHVRNGTISINNKLYSSNVIISYKGLIQEFKLDSSHIFSWKDFNKLLVENPETIVIGSGQRGCIHIETDVHRLAELKNVQIMEFQTEKAVEKFNQMLSENKKVVGYFHLTC